MWTGILRNATRHPMTGSVSVPRALDVDGRQGFPLIIAA